MSETMTWRPIDTAPKDGTRVLLSEGALVVLGQWSDWGGTFKSQGWRFDEGYDDPPSFDPTYWHPLPDPPKASAPA